MSERILRNRSWSLTRDPDDPHRIELALPSQKNNSPVTLTMTTNLFKDGLFVDYFQNLQEEISDPLSRTELMGLVSKLLEVMQSERCDKLFIEPGEPSIQRLMKEIGGTDDPENFKSLRTGIGTKDDGSDTFTPLAMVTIEQLKTYRTRLVSRV